MPTSSCLASAPSRPRRRPEAAAKEAEEARQTETQALSACRDQARCRRGVPGALGDAADPAQPRAAADRRRRTRAPGGAAAAVLSIVEHLKELLRNQGETLDRTNTAQAQREEAERRRRAGPLVGEEDKHAELGKALAEALAAQADQAANAKEPAAKQAQKPLSEVAEEVRKAHAAMQQAATLLKPTGRRRTAQRAGQSMPLDLEPAMEQEKGAMAHLEAAIRILEPPQQKPQQNENQKSQPEQQQQLSQEQAARRLQAIREREAERQRKRQQPGNNEPVEKDW